MRNFFSSLLFLSIFTFVAFSMSSTEAFARSDICPRHQVQTFLKAKRSKPQYLSGSLKGINDYLNSHSVLAFAQDPFDAEMDFKFSFLDMGDRRFCVMLEKVRVHYISFPKIVMPSNFRRKSCEYKLILKHEKRHLKVFNDYFDNGVARYEAFLGRIARSVPVGPPVKRHEDRDEVINYIKDYFSDEFSILMAKSRSEMHLLQDKIDSQQEYVFTNRKIDRCAEERRNKNKKNKKSIKAYDD